MYWRVTRRSSDSLLCVGPGMSAGGGTRLCQPGLDATLPAILALKDERDEAGRVVR